MAWGYRNVVGSLHRSPELGRLWLAYFVIAVLYNQTDAAFKMMHPVWIAFLLAITVVPSLASPARRRGHDYGKSALSTGSVSDDGRVRSPRSLLSALIVSSEEEEREYQRRYS
jgi:hypothetical protein